jgi:hypothetical protein
MVITIKPILHQNQRYETVGDWWFDADGNLEIRVSMMGEQRHEFLIGLHEMVEAVLCNANGVKEVYVSAFDIAFEEKRPPENTDEPGNDPSAPYFHEHQIATQVEKIVADALKVDWSTYDKAVWDL